MNNVLAKYEKWLMPLAVVAMFLLIILFIINTDKISDKLYTGKTMVHSSEDFYTTNVSLTVAEKQRSYQGISSYIPLYLVRVYSEEHPQYNDNWIHVSSQDYKTMETGEIYEFEVKVKTVTRDYIGLSK